MGASPGALGAVRGLWHSRIPFEVLGCHVYPTMSGLPKADKAFTPEGDLIDESARQRLTELLNAYVKFIG